MPHLGQTPPNLTPGVAPFGVTPPFPTFGSAVFGIDVFGGHLPTAPALSGVVHSAFPSLTSIPDLMPPNLLP